MYRRCYSCRRRRRLRGALEAATLRVVMVVVGGSLGVGG